MSLVYQSRVGFIPLVIAAIGGSVVLHAAVPTLVTSQLVHEEEQQEIVRQETGIQGAIMFDLSDEIAAPSDTSEDSAEVAEAEEAPTVTDSPHSLDPAQAAEQPLLQQVPYDIKDDSLKFDVAAPETEEETEKKATEIAEEFQEEKTEVQASVGAEQTDASDASVSGVDADQNADSAQAASEGLSAEQLEEISDWQKSIVIRIAKAKTYPQSARKDGIEGEVRVAFEIDRYGRVLTREIEKSSGYPALDEAALKVLDEIGKMPTPPNHLEGETFAMVIPFNFRIKK